MNKVTEQQACFPEQVDGSQLNSQCQLPYGLNANHVYKAMRDFLEFLGFINQQLHTKSIPRLESFLLPANFSSIVGEFMNMTIPRYCDGLVKNRCHNGHPDRIPTGAFPEDAVQYATEGIEVKGVSTSRRLARAQPRSSVVDGLSLRQQYSE